MNTREQLIAIIQDRLCVDSTITDSIQDDTRLDSFIEDSTDLLDIIFHVEGAFNISIPPPSLSPDEKKSVFYRMETFGGLIGLVNELQQEERFIVRL